MTPTVSGSLPLLDNVTACDVLEVPMVTAAKVRLLGVTVAPAPIALPLRVIT